jgi:hypothetical protein
VGAQVWLDACAPPAASTDAAADVQGRAFVLSGTVGSDAEATLAGLREFDPHAVVVFDPPALPEQMQRALTERALDCATVGILVSGLPGAEANFQARCCDRLVSFDPALTGEGVGAGRVWRAIPPPVSDAFFADVRPLHGSSRAITIGHSTAQREAIIEPAKHHHDLMQVLHGVTGATLVELLADYDVGVYVPPHGGRGFGVQVGLHLAAGQLLVASLLGPTHGLERDIDYLQVDSADALAHLLERLGRFPEMYFRIRVRGRMKAEHYRASRLLARLTYDLLADVAAFGRS